MGLEVGFSVIFKQMLWFFLLSLQQRQVKLKPPIQPLICVNVNRKLRAWWQDMSADRPQLDGTLYTVMNLSMRMKSNTAERKNRKNNTISIYHFFCCCRCSIHTVCVNVYNSFSWWCFFFAIWRMAIRETQQRRKWCQNEWIECEWTSEQEREREITRPNSYSAR